MHNKLHKENGAIYLSNITHNKTLTEYEEMYK